MTIQVPAPTGADDYTIISTAISQAAKLGQAIAFQEKAAYRTSLPICIGDGSPIPRGVLGNGATITATTSGASEIMRLTNPHAMQEQFFVEDLVLDAAQAAYRCLTVHGLQYGFLRRMRLFNPTSIGFAIDAGKGYGCYYNEVSGFLVRGSAWLGLRWQDNLADYAAEGSHIQGNTVTNLNVQKNQQNAWMQGVQDSISGRFESSTQPGMRIDHTIQFDLENCYFENNMVGTVDTAVEVDDATASNVVRRGGQWTGAVSGTVRTA